MINPDLVSAVLALHQTGASSETISGLTALPPVHTQDLLARSPLRTPPPRERLLPRARILAYTEQFFRFYDATDPDRLVCERFLEAVHRFCLVNGYARQSLINELYAIFRTRIDAEVPPGARARPSTATAHPVY